VEFNCYKNLGELSAETLEYGQKKSLYFQLSSATQGYWKNSERKNHRTWYWLRNNNASYWISNTLPCRNENNYVYTSHAPTHTISMTGKDMLNWQISMFYMHSCIL